MKAGDLVMFTDDKGTYARWFYGQFAIAESVSQNLNTGDWHCRVRWLQPVLYHSSYASVSDFGVNKFEVYDENR